MLSFELMHSSQVTVDVLDLIGKKVATVLDQQMPIGNNLVKNSNLSLSSGYYFVQINVNGQKAVSYPMVIEQNVLYIIREHGKILAMFADFFCFFLFIIFNVFYQGALWVSL